MERICSMFVDGTVPFDMPLSERAISDTVGIGRMPVREALRDLARDGIVTVEPGRGTFLRRLTPTQVSELLEVRLAIESTAARLAAQRSYVGDFPEIVSTLRNLRKGPLTGDRVSFAEVVGDRVHNGIVEGAGNETLSSVYSGLRLRIGISLRLVQRRDVKRIRETVDEHLAIVEAVLKKSPQAAVKALQYHLRKGHTTTMSYLVDRPAFRANGNKSIATSARARPRGRPKL
jgi:DNA-binding GntR family transcriptional regulator